MNQEFVYSQLCNKIKELKKDNSELSSNSVLLGNGGILDSLLIIQIVQWCKDVFNVDLIDDDINLKYLDTIGTLTDYLYTSRSFE